MYEIKFHTKIYSAWFTGLRSFFLVFRFLVNLRERNEVPYERFWTEKYEIFHLRKFLPLQYGYPRKKVNAQRFTGNMETSPAM